MRQRAALFLVLIAAAGPRAFAQAPAETIEYYGTDTIGSIRIVFDVNGTVLGRQDFTPFGTPVVPPSALPREGFGGNEQDDETDLSYFHARMLQVRAGRFTRPDPIQDGAFEPQRWNRYAYALNAPLTVTDDMGLFPTIPMVCGTIVYCDSTGVTAPYIPGEPIGGTGGGPGDGMYIIPTIGDGVGGSVGGSGTSTTTTTNTTTTESATPIIPAGNPAKPLNSTDCPSVPVAPPTANLRLNIQEAGMANAAFEGHSGSWFYDKVRNGRGRAADVRTNRSWDYKQIGHQYEDFTNVNYAATGQAANYSYTTLALASLHAHFVSHGAEGLLPSQLANEAHDQLVIWRGLQFSSRSCQYLHSHGTD
jgi:RHS repeat-associated protein